MVKYRSRATRADEAATALDNILIELVGIRDSLSVEVPKDTIEFVKMTDEEAVKKAQEIADKIDYSEVENLTAEMTGWRDNMMGTNLEATTKYSDVSETADALEQIDCEAPSIEDVEDISVVIEKLKEDSNTLRELTFPRMYK